MRCSKLHELGKLIQILKNNQDSSFVEIRCGKGHRKNVSRPKDSLLLLKNRLKNKIKSLRLKKLKKIKINKLKLIFFI